MFKSQTECRKVIDEQCNYLLHPSQKKTVYTFLLRGKRTITEGGFAFIQSTPELLEQKKEWFYFLSSVSYVANEKEYNKIYRTVLYNEDNESSLIDWMGHFNCILPKRDSGLTYISDEDLKLLESVYWEINENNHIIFHKNNEQIDLGKLMNKKERTVSLLNIYFKKIILPLARIANSYYVEDTWDHMPTAEDFINSN